MYVLSDCCGPGTALVSGGTAVNEADFAAIMELATLVGGKQ